MQTKYDYLSADVKEDHALSIVNENYVFQRRAFKVRCYGADDVREGVAIMWHEGVDVSITGNSTNPTVSSIRRGHLQEECIGLVRVFLRGFRRRHWLVPCIPTTWPPARLLA